MTQVVVNYDEIRTLSSAIEEDLDSTPIWQGGGDEPVKTPTWKGKGKEVANHNSSSNSHVQYRSTPSPADSAIEVEDLEVAWTEYEPPVCLSEVSDDETEVIAKIVQESIERIKAKVMEDAEARLKVQEAEAQTRQNEAKAEKEVFYDAEELTEPSPASSEDWPLKGPVDNLQNLGNGQGSAFPRYCRVEPTTFAGIELVPDDDGFLHLMPKTSTKPKRRTLRGFLRRLNTSDKPESSAQGASRHQHRGSAGSLGIAASTTRRRYAVDVAVRAATNNQTKPRPSVQEDEVECVSCLEDFAPKDMVKVPCHGYCFDCFHRLIRTACENEQQWPPKCCLNTIPPATITAGISREADLQQEYRAKTLERSVPIGERIYCSSRSDNTCNLFILPDQINHGLSLARCSAGHWTCTLCRGPQHENSPSTTCPQDRDLQQTEQLAAEEGWKRCHQCRALVEHREACQHMTCRCGAQFCYVCSAPWRTCACTMEQLHAVKRAAADRRLAREARLARAEEAAAAEEAELREALRLVEELEREEARKETLLQLERERAAREQRAMEIRERLRKEEARREGVRVSFQELRQRLLELHNCQRMAVLREHGREESTLYRETETSMAALREQGEAASEKILIEGSRRLLDFDLAMDNELATRVRFERQIEEEYEQQLCVYWAHKTGGAGHMEAALNSLKRRMDKGFRAWSRWMEDEQEKQRFLVQEEQTAQAYLADKAERELAYDHGRRRKEFTNRRTAEMRWVIFVVEERESMLDHLEAEELEDGEDVAALLLELAALLLELNQEDVASDAS